MGYVGAILGLSWEDLGGYFYNGFMSVFEHALWVPKSSLGHLGDILGLSWDDLGATWGNLGATLRHVGRSWEYLGRTSGLL